MIDERIAKEVIEFGLSHGAEYVEIFSEHTIQRGVTILNGDIKNLIHSEIYGTGIRTITNGKTGYAYTNTFTESKLIQLIKTLTSEVSLGYFPVGIQKNNIEICEKKTFDNIKNATRLKLISDIYRPAKELSNEINLAGVEYIDIEQNVFICDSEGLFQYDHRPRSRCTVKVVASDEKNSQTGIKSLGGSTGYSYWDNVDLVSFGESAAKTAINMLHASECPSGTYPVVIENGFGGVIFHEACGHTLETSNIVNNYAEFGNKIDKKIAADCVTYVDDGTITGGWGSSSIDDEGTTTQQTIIIKNGILQTYLSDKLGAEKLNQKRTGNGRRQNYTCIPTSRMTNTYIMGGSDDPDSLLVGIKEGLYVKDVGGGSANVVSGEFNFTVTEGYWIENGKISYPVKGASLIGKSSEVLMDIEKIANNLKMGQGMCVSKSGKIPVGVGQPRIKVSNILIGGKRKL